MKLICRFESIVLLDRVFSLFDDDDDEMEDLYVNLVRSRPL